jgi:hypothetical protein
VNTCVNCLFSTRLPVPLFLRPRSIPVISLSPVDGAEPSPQPYTTGTNDDFRNGLLHLLTSELYNKMTDKPATRLHEKEQMEQYILNLENQLKEAELTIAQDKSSIQELLKKSPALAAPRTLRPAAVKLPEFWADDVSLWFRQCEAIFTSNDIDDEKQMFNSIVGRLPPSVAVSCRSLLMEIDPTVRTPYTMLKTHLTKCFGRTDWQLAFAIMDAPSLGDRRPSQMLQDMRALMPKGETEGRLFLAHFVRRLPTKVSDLLLATDVIDADQMAAAADRMVQIPEPTPVAAIAEVPSPRKARSPNRSPGYKKRPQTPGPKDKKHCWYHAKYGKDASKCQPPCRWEAEN